MPRFSRFRAASVALPVLAGLAPILAGLAPSLAHADWAPEAAFGVAEPVAAMDFSAALTDGQRLKLALTALAKGEMNGAERWAARLQSDSAITGYRWAKLRRAREPALADLLSFAQRHPDWAGAGWLAGMIEATLVRTNAPPSLVRATLGAKAPVSPIGRYALAKARRAGGEVAQANAAIRGLWRESADDPWLEAILVRDEAALFTRADDARRAARLLAAGEFGGGLRAAARAGGDVLAGAGLYAVAAHGGAIPALSPDAPAAKNLTAMAMLAQAREARRTGRLQDAARWFQLAPDDAQALGDPDAWWQERRVLVRALLDSGAVEAAYSLAATIEAGSAATLSDAHFRAGWIALRFRNDPLTALAQFDASAEACGSDGAQARADYWRARAHAQLGDDDSAQEGFVAAARHVGVYYGQLAALALGRDETPPPPRVEAATGAARDESTGVADMLFSAGQADLAFALIFAHLGRTRDPAQVAALAALVEAHGDASVRLAFGRIAIARGFAEAAAAFPLTSVADVTPLAHSADRSTVLAVIRQESGFIARAASRAGAHGLMQLLPETARETARRAGVPFDPGRFAADPSFNVQLGAAYLGQLMQDLGGSTPIALAAYNAGPARVERWFQTYGDPRIGQTDIVDWVERIPFDETREYVQRVTEAIGVYRARLGAQERPGYAMASER